MNTIEKVDIKEKLEKQLMDFLEHCVNHQRCEEDDVMSIEALPAYSEEWMEAIVRIKSIVADTYKVFFLFFLKLVEDVDDLEYLENYDSNDFYYYELNNNPFEAHHLWSGEIINCPDTFCGYIDLTKTRDLINEIENATEVNKLLAYSVIYMDKKRIENGGRFIISNYKTDGENLSNDRLLTAIKLQMVLNGDSMRKMKDYDKKPLQNINISNNIDCISLFAIKDKKYEQIDEICDAFSDYNATKGILDKYLRLYQIFEELMVRRAIVPYTDVTQLTVRMIAEFKEMKKSEIETLTDLLREMLRDPNNENNVESVYLQAISDFWNGLSSREKDYLADWYFSDCKIGRNEKSFSDLLISGKTNISNNIAFWIYQMRCRIVHNKATEYHLTYQNLDDVQYSILSNYLIPMMEMFLVRTIAQMPLFIQYNKQTLSIKLY